VDCRNLAPFQGALNRGQSPGVSLRSTPGYLLATLWVAKAEAEKTNYLSEADYDNL
jgi:hypothetical protein